MRNLIILERMRIIDNGKTYKIDPDKWISLDSDPDFDLFSKLFIPMSIPITTVTSPFIKITIEGEKIIVNINQIQMVTIDSIKIDDKWYSISLETYEKLLSLLNIINK